MCGLVVTKSGRAKIAREDSCHRFDPARLRAAAKWLPAGYEPEVLQALYAYVAPTMHAPRFAVRGGWRARRGLSNDLAFGLHLRRSAPSSYGGPGMSALDRCINVADFGALARRRMPAPIVDYCEGAAEDEQTLARNRASFADWSLVPNQMRDVSKVDASTTLLGQKVSWPFVVAPTGMPGLLHPDGEFGIARAAAATGSLYTLSTMASRSIEEVATATEAPKAFQLYVFRDRGITRELIQRARAAGYAALILAVDIPVPANRERDKRNGMVIPPKFTPRTLLEFARHPLWCWNVLVRQPVTLANFSGDRAGPGVPLLSFISQQFDPAVTWKDLEWVAALWNGPLGIKGIMAVDDAVTAVDHGARTVIVSNHGGRQLDGAAAPLDMLPRMADRLAGSAELILDGGVRRGTDMLKAMALGANGCMGGRVGLYGLGAGGSAGAKRALGTLRSEFDRDLALLGTTDIAAINRAHVVPA